IHAAKGLEFANVFIVGVEEELLPSSMSMSSPQEIEEERRLLYVALTRAKKYCMMSYASSRFHNGQTKTCQPSRFIADIDRRFLRAESGSDIAAASKSRTEYSSFNRFEPLRKPASQSAPLQQTIRPSFKQTTVPADGDFSTHPSSELETGMKIEHQRFGVGTILEIDRSQSDHKIVVDFNNVQQRTLLLKFARFKILGQ
ncbi:MAG: ATP-binding domain-containing protein, partial [Muribaculaceae bacterium]|nr:ATP-binding domain-containing protein [Muribaculaceae bacterium]